MTTNRVVKKNFSRLKAFTKGMNQKFVGRVGIIGSQSNDRDADTMGNAEIGVVMEFGSATMNIDSRSFLRMPITKKSKQIINDVFLHKKKIKKEIADGNIKFLYQVLATAAEGQVLNAFDTKGFGTWKPLDEKTIKRRKNQSDTPLIDTGQLRGSITSDVGKANG